MHLGFDQSEVGIVVFLGGLVGLIALGSTFER